MNEEEKKTSIEEDVIELVNPSIEKIKKDGLNTTNLEYLYKLMKIRHIAKEDMDMYGEYGNYYGRDEYGRDRYGRDEYGARRRDSRGRYMGHEHLDRMYDDYGRYMESRERYGAGSEDSKKSLKYMLESMENFARMLKADATSQEEIMMIKQTAQRIANM